MKSPATIEIGSRQMDRDTIGAEGAETSRGRCPEDVDGILAVRRPCAGEGQVGDAVVPKVPGHQRHVRGDRVPVQIVCGALERSVAVTEKDRHVVGVQIGDGQVDAAIAVEVARHDAIGRLDRCGYKRAGSI